MGGGAGFWLKCAAPARERTSRLVFFQHNIHQRTDVDVAVHLAPSSRASRKQLFQRRHKGGVLLRFALRRPAQTPAALPDFLRRVPLVQ